MQSFYKALTEKIESEISAQEAVLEQIEFYESVVKAKYGVDLKPQKELQLKTKEKKEAFILQTVDLIKQIESRLKSIITLKAVIKKQQEYLAQKSTLLHKQLDSFLRQSLSQRYNLDLNKKYSLDDYLSHLSTGEIKISDPIPFFAAENLALEEIIEELNVEKQDIDEIIKDVELWLEYDKKIQNLLKDLNAMQPFIKSIPALKHLRSDISELQQKYHQSKNKKIKDFDTRSTKYGDFYRELSTVKTIIRRAVRQHYSQKNYHHNRISYEHLDRILGTNYQTQATYRELVELAGALVESGLNGKSPRSSSTPGGWSTSSSHSIGGFSGGRSAGSMSRSGGW